MVFVHVRVWMCGGTIQIVTCSRVAVRAAQQALSISDDKDLRHIVELTFTDELRRLVYRQARVDDTMSGKESDSLMVRRSYLRRQHAELECRPFGWYLANIAMPDVMHPSTDADHFGKLRSARSGLCLGSESEAGVELVTCHEYLYEHQLLVEMTARGAIVRDGNCLELRDTSVAFAPCQADSPRQHWWMVDGRLTAVTAPRKCLTDSQAHAAHLAVLDDCASPDAKDLSDKQRWSFINF